MTGDKVLKLEDILLWIEEADGLKLHDVMNAVRRRYASKYPQWDVFYIAIHKEPETRRKELEELVTYIEKDLKWNEEKKDSLG